MSQTAHQAISQDDTHRSGGLRGKDSMNWWLHALLMTLLCQSQHQARHIQPAQVYEDSLWKAETFVTKAAMAQLQLMTHVSTCRTPKPGS